jgi:P4 family phage/plasmid primase-like protien
MQELQQFIKKFQTSSPPYSHTSYIGGKYYIPKSQYSKFSQLYYNSIKLYYSNESIQPQSKIFLIERLLDTFRYCQDIDNKDTSLTDSDIKELIVATLYEIKEITGNEIDATFIVLKRQANYHIHYDYITSSQQAIELTHKIKLKLTNDISKTLDESPYKNGGMRMIGAFNKNKIDFYKIYNLDTRSYEPLCFDKFKQTLLNSDTNGSNTNGSNTNGSNTNGSNTNGSNTGSSGVQSKQDIEIAKEISQLFIDLKQESDWGNRLRERIIGIEKLSEFDLSIEKIRHLKNKYTGLSNFYILTKEQLCPFKNRQHKRDSSCIYIDLSYKGAFIRCYDQDCSTKLFPTDSIKFPLDWTPFIQKYPIVSRLLTVKYYQSHVDMTPDIKGLVEASLTGTNYSMAKLIFTIYKDKFRIDEMKNSEWYFFNGTRWTKTNKLSILISEDIPKYYKSIKLDTSSELDADIDQDQTVHTGKDMIKYNDAIDKCILQLESTLFKKNIIEELKIMFFELDRTFIQKLDANPNLLGFENGVYDLDAGLFRPGKIDDYISYSTKYDYIDYDPNNSIVLEIHDFFKKLLPKDDVREYTLKTLGRGLLGIPDEKFYMWTGISGQNGKSTLTKLLEYVYGEYAISCDTALLTNKRNGSSNASPDLMEMKGKRAVFFQEPENSDTLKTGLLKQLSGGDTVKARELFKSIVSFVCQAMFVMCCNELPKIHAKNDGGSWRRIRVVDFISKFVDNPKPQVENQPANYEFKIDYTLKQKMTYWLPYVMSILVHYFHKQKLEGNVEPKQVMQATDRYKGDNNEFEDYFDSCIIAGIPGSETTFTTIKHLYENFLDWWEDTYGQEKPPSIIELKRVMTLKYGNPLSKNIDNRQQKGFNVVFNTRE